MHILCSGINHLTAGVDLREQLAFDEQSLKSALARLGCGLPRDEVLQEMVILSTCNRVEIYAVAAQPAFDVLEDFLADCRGLPAAKFHHALYHFLDEQAVAHLLEVASGLDSMVLGEPQILGQVTQALELARGQDTVGPVLSRLFQAAIHTGKRVRTETAIACNPTSISTVAVRLASEDCPHLEDARVVVLGAGEMAELVVEALRKRGQMHLTVVNRTLERARKLAVRWQGQASTFESLPLLLEYADILITSTGAPHTLLHPPMVAAAMRRREARPLVIIDIAVPRDVDPQIGGIDGVSLYDMDALKAFLDRSLTAREEQLPDARQIITQEQVAFMEYLGTLDLLPVIRELRQQAENIRQAELEKTFRRMPNLTDADRQRIEALTLAVVKKILHAPITRLRSEALNSHGGEYAILTRSLFSLSQVDLETQESLFASQDVAQSIHPSNTSLSAPD